MFDNIRQDLLAHGGDRGRQGFRALAGCRSGRGYCGGIDTRDTTQVLDRSRIGNNVTIAANALVARNVPDESITAAMPAAVRPRKRRDA